MVTHYLFPLRTKFFYTCMFCCLFSLFMIASLLFHAPADILIQQSLVSSSLLSGEYLVTAFAVAGIGSALCCYLLARYFSRRLSLVQRAIQQLASGKLDIDLEIDGSDELSLLASQINQLACRLSNERENMLLSVIESLINALEAKDTYTYSHSSEVADIALHIGQALHLPDDQLFQINFAAILHDIGKIGIPTPILNKPEPLTDEEWDMIKQHPVIGARIIAGIPFLSHVSDIILHHHARWDGTGYPSSLAGTDIPLGSRIIAVADSYQAMTSTRPYRESISHQEAIRQLTRNAATQFDPDIIAIFIKLYANKYGSPA